MNWLVVGIIACVLCLLLGYILPHRKKSSEPIVGEFTIFIKPSDDNEAVYKMDFYDHPLNWKDKKTVRIKVSTKE